MRVKFNHMERVAGLFVIFAVVGAFTIAIGIAFKKGYFDSKITYVTTFETADGIFPGTVVQISGLRAGAVDEVELQNDNKIRVVFSVLNKFEHRIKQDSVTQLIRPFIIGDRILDLQVGSENSPILKAGGMITSKESMDLLSLLNGKKMGSVIELMSGMVSNLKVLGEAMSDPKTTEALLKTFGRIDPLIRNLNTMSVEVISLSRQMNKNDNISEIVQNLALTTKEIRQIMPAVKDKTPAMYKDLNNLVQNLNLLTTEFKVVLPALAEIAPDLPYASHRAMEALDQSVILLKAMQKSFVLRSNVEEIKEEEAKEHKTKKRIPATINPD